MELITVIRYQSFDPSKKPSLLGKLGCDEDEIEDILNCIYKHGLNFVGTHFYINAPGHSYAAFKNGI